MRVHNGDTLVITSSFACHHFGIIIVWATLLDSLNKTLNFVVFICSVLVVDHIQTKEDTRLNLSIAWCPTTIHYEKNQGALKAAKILLFWLPWQRVFVLKHRFMWFGFLRLINFTNYCVIPHTVYFGDLVKSTVENSLLFSYSFLILLCSNIKITISNS